MAQSTNAQLLAATVTPLLFFVGVGLLLLPVLLEVLWLEDEDVEDDEVEDDEDDLDDVACNLALLAVEFVVEFVVEFIPDMVMFAMLPPIVELVLEPVAVELPDDPRAPVELLLDLGPGATIGVSLLLFEVEEAVEEGEETVAEPVEDFEAEVEARAAAASVGQVEHP